MIKIPYDTIISKLKEGSNLSEDEINAKIKQKMDQLSGLISKEGAAHIIANELNIKLVEEGGTLKIKDVLAGMKTVGTVGKVTNIFETRTFQRKDGSEGKVASLIIADETARARVVMWNDQTDMLRNLKAEDTVKITNGFAKESQNGLEIHLASKSELIINPEGLKIESIASAQKPQAKRKSIQELGDTDTNIELLGTVVQVFEPRFYEVHPQTGKRIKPKDDSKFYDDDNKEIKPAFAAVMNLVIDDGTETIRTVFFRNQLANLLKMENSELVKFKDNPSDFISTKEDLLGKIIKIVGRVSKNEMFDRKEFVAQLVFPDPDASDELKKLEEEAKVIE